MESRTSTVIAHALLDGAGDEGSSEKVTPVPVALPINRASKDRFQKYLDKTGVSATILRGIVSLYEDENKPNDPIRFLCEQWGFGIPEIVDVDSLQAEVIQLRDRYHSLCRENESLKLLTEPKPAPDEEMGMDQETIQLLRKQEQEVTKIQRREACILKAYEAAKVVKEQPNICAPPIPEEARSRHLVTVRAGDSGLVDNKEGEEDGEEPIPASPALICSQDVLYEGQENVNGDIWRGEDNEDRSITITIPVEQLKNQPRHTCGQEIQSHPH